MPAIVAWFAALLLLLPVSAGAGPVLAAELRGAVTPASAAYLERTLEEARRQQAELVVLRMDTPGGLDTAMRKMIQDILASPVPVAIFVHPQGARAASAGTYLLYASHVAAMAPGTNLGAATPVAIGPGGGDRPGGKGDDKDGKGEKPPASAMEAKAMQDAAAYIRGLAQLRGRNGDWAERAVREAASLSAEDAARMRVIDLVAEDLPDLLKRLEGRQLNMGGGRTKVLVLTGAPVVEVAPNWQEKALATIADPNIALILMMIGVYGLLFEFYSPGLAGPGILGGICLLLGLYGLALLPINWVGAALMLLGIALLVGEAFMPSFGLLGLGGIAAFVVGALMLVEPEAPGLSVSWKLVLPIAVFGGLVVVGVGFIALRVRRQPSVSGQSAMLGSTAVALEDIGGEGWVQAFGERWWARSPVPLPRGARARIVALEGLTLVVEPIPQQGEHK